MSVSARRPSPGPCRSTIVPVVAMPSEQPVRTPPKRPGPVRSPSSRTKPAVRAATPDRCPRTIRRTCRARHHPRNRRGNLAARAEVHGDLVMLQPVDEQLEARVARQRGPGCTSARCGRAPRQPAPSARHSQRRCRGCGPGSGFLPRCRSSRGPPFTKRLPGDGPEVAGRRPRRRGSRRAADVPSAARGRCRNRPMVCASFSSRGSANAGERSLHGHPLTGGPLS